MPRATPQEWTDLLPASEIELPLDRVVVNTFFEVVEFVRDGVGYA